MLTNPSAISYQNLSMAMKRKPEEKEKPKTTLMGPPKKQIENSKKDDALEPSRRVASYIEMLKKKREEIINV